MPDELTELLDTAIYKEIASQATYTAGQSKTRDPAARALMKELADEAGVTRTEVNRFERGLPLPLNSKRKILKELWAVKAS